MDAHVGAKALPHAWNEQPADVVHVHARDDHVGHGLERDAGGIEPMATLVAIVEVGSGSTPSLTTSDFSHTVMPNPVPEVLRSTATSFYNEYRDKLRIFETTCDVAPGVTVRLSGGHTPGHSVVDPVSGGERLMFGGDAMFPAAFDHPDWQNGFEHDPEESTRVRIGLFEELVETGGLLVAAHLPFSSVGRVAADGDVFRWVPMIWDF